MRSLVSFPRYEEYKESGEQWIGEIPKHWELLANKYIFSLKKNLVGKRSAQYDLLSLTLRGIIKRDMENPEGKFPAEFDTYQEVKVNDFVFCLFDVEETPRTVGLSKYDGMITGAYTVFSVSTEFNKDFLYYLYLNLDTGKRLRFLYKGLRNTISKEDFFSFKIACPAAHEQKNIATFLNQKTAQIDQAIDIKKKQIELLKERQQVVIQQAVTKGLDPSVKMKDSGIEWIGEVPEHWETVRFRNFFKFNRGLSITKENLRDEGIPCVSYGEVHSEFGFEVNPKKHKLMCVSNDYLAKNKNSLIRKGDVVYADTSEDIEGAGNFTQLVTNDIVFAGYHTIICKPLKSINFRYLAYCLDSISYRNQIRKQVKGVKVYSITQSILKNTYIWLPSDREQEEITHYLDQMRSQIKLAIETEERQIKKLQEYKSSLINSAVTGKIKITPDMIAAEE